MKGLLFKLVNSVGTGHLKAPYPFAWTAFLEGLRTTTCEIISARRSPNQGADFYHYVQNNPLRWIDPSGNGDPEECFVVTPSGTAQVPCTNRCLGNVCNVTPVGPPPPLIPVEDPWLYEDSALLNQIHGCLAKQIEEINQIETESTNESLSDLPKIPGKGLGIQGIESLLEKFGVEGAELAGVGADGLVFVLDIGEELHHNYEFKRKLKEAQQH